MKNLKWTLCLITILCFPLFNSDSQGAGAPTGGSPLAAGLIDPSRTINWSNAGVIGGIPSGSWPACTTAQAGTTVPIPAYTGTAATINNAIIACGTANPNGSYLQLAAGTFNLSNGITWWTTSYNNSTSAVSNVALRGMGGNQTFLVFTGNDFCNGDDSMICMMGSGNAAGYEDNVCDWTAGYNQGATTISLSNCGTTTPAKGSLSNLKIGTSLILDQVDEANDTGEVWNCTQGNSCTLEGNGSLARTNGPTVNGIANRSQQQMVQVTNCTNVGGVCTSGSNITVSPGLYMSNWRSSQLPQAWFANTLMNHDGVENLSVDDGGVWVADSSISIDSCYQCWIKGVRSLTASRSHFLVAWSGHPSIVDNYIYENLTHQAESYGMELRQAFDGLIQNNIAQQTTDCSPTTAGEGNVVAHNYAIDESYQQGTGGGDWFMATYFLHDSGDAFNLFEGNVGTGYNADDIHGTHHLETLFRNYLQGWQAACGDTTCYNQTVPVTLMGGSRFFNLLGNVLGTPGYHNQYQCEALSTASCANVVTSIYSLGYTEYVGTSDPNITGFCTSPSCSSNNDYDPQTPNYLLRWGNWDVVNNATQWNPSEVPSAIGAYQSAVPSTQTLPPSLYLTAKPAWWGNTPWPAIGPDVSNGGVGTCSGGNYNRMPTMNSSQCTGGSLNASSLGGHVAANPAMNCFLNTMGGPADGSGNSLTFNAATCYPGDFGASTVAYGDVSGDSSPTIYDALLVAQYAVGSITLTPTQIQESKVSSASESAPSIYDALLIAQYAVGLITKFPVQ